MAYQQYAIILLPLLYQLPPVRDLNTVEVGVVSSQAGWPSLASLVLIFKRRKCGLSPFP